MKAKTITLQFLIAILLLTGCLSKKDKNQTITISGAFAIYPMVIKWSEEYNKIHPEVQFDITGGGAGKGMADALSGVVDLGMFSREITQEEKNKGVWWVGLAIDAVVPTISSSNPYLEQIKQRGVTSEEFRMIFIESKFKTWEEFLKIKGKGATDLVVYTRSDACGAAETWGQYMGGSQEELIGIGIFGDPGLAEAVTKDPKGIGFNNTIYAYDIKTGNKREGIDIIPIDINENGQIDPEERFYDSFDQILKAIADGIYPSPPSRELYFVANGKPQKEVVVDFIKWCLTEGQQYVTEAGYVPLKPNVIDSYLKLLE
jgi:phosphate transport system substrate-binding protein